MYFYRVRAANNNGASASSNVISLTTLFDPPVATAATDITTNSFTAHWNVATYASGYYLDVSTDASFTTMVNNSGTGNENVGNVLSKSVTGLSTGTTYFYRVRAYNGTVVTISSNKISCITTKNLQTISFTAFSSPLIFGAAPFDLTASATSGLTVTFSSDNTSVATISGNTVTVLGVGTVNITASQAGNSNYYAASDYVRQLVVLPNTAAPGNALSFNGSSDYVTVPYNFSGYTAFTIEAWVKPASTTDQCIIAGNDGSNFTHSHAIEIKNGKFNHYNYDGSVINVAGTTTIIAGNGIMWQSPEVTMGMHDCM